MNRIMMLILCLAMFGKMDAQRAYTLEECRGMALDNNAKMRNARNDKAAAMEQKRQAMTAFFPNVSATGAAFNANKGLVEAELMPGMAMSLIKNGVVGGITATQPLFAGGQIVNSNRLAKTAVEVAEISEEKQRNEINMRTEQLVWQIATLREKQRTLVLLNRMLCRLEGDVEAAVKAGVANRNELLQVQLKKNEVESSAVAVGNGLSLSLMVLAQHVGADTADFDVAVEVPESLPQSPMALKRDHDKSLRGTVSYRLLEKNVEAGQLQKRIEVGKRLPSVAVGAGYMYDNLMDKDHAFAMAFATVSVPISDWWGGSHAIKRQRLKVENAENDLRDGSQQLIIAMQSAWNELDNAYRLMEIAHRSIAQSAENLRLNEQYYKAGTSTMSDLIEAQSLYQQSCDKYAEQYAQYQIKQLEYKQATGGEE